MLQMLLLVFLLLLLPLLGVLTCGGPAYSLLLAMSLCVHFHTLHSSGELVGGGGYSWRLGGGILPRGVLHGSQAIPGGRLYTVN